jgi:DNA-binding MarR family transcriptional regulator
MRNAHRRQHVVKRPARSEAGAVFADVVVRVNRLSRRLTAIAARLTQPSGQTLARWLVMAECADAPATVADIARRLALARQGVQRVADALERQGLCVYLDNPRHTRASLLALTPKGRRTLERIESAQRQWSESLGRRIGEPALREINGAVGRLLDAIEADCGV